MSCEDTTVKRLKESGHRLTPQRLLILSAVRHAEHHISVAEVLDLVKASYPYVDVSTVYRTLGVLKDLRLVTETDMGDGTSRYEWTGKHRHHHLICKVCNGVTEIDHDHLDNLTAELFSEHDFEADMEHFAIFGVCGGCRQNGAGT